MPLVPSFFSRPPRRRLADLIRVLTDIREYAATAAANTAHIIHSLTELKEHVMTDPNREPVDPSQPDPNGPAQPDEPQPPQPDEPDTDKGKGRRR